MYHSPLTKSFRSCRFFGEDELKEALASSAYTWTSRGHPAKGKKDGKHRKLYVEHASHLYFIPEVSKDVWMGCVDTLREGGTPHHRRRRTLDIMEQFSQDVIGNSAASTNMQDTMGGHDDIETHETHEKNQQGAVPVHGAKRTLFGVDTALLPEDVVHHHPHTPRLTATSLAPQPTHLFRCRLGPWRVTETWKCPCQDLSTLLRSALHGLFHCA